MAYFLLLKSKVAEWQYTLQKSDALSLWQKQESTTVDIHRPPETTKSLQSDTFRDSYILPRGYNMWLTKYKFIHQPTK